MSMKSRDFWKIQKYNEPQPYVEKKQHIPFIKTNVLPQYNLQPIKDVVTQAGTVASKYDRGNAVYGDELTNESYYSALNKNLSAEGLDPNNITVSDLSRLNREVATKYAQHEADKKSNVTTAGRMEANYTAYNEYLKNEQEIVKQAEGKGIANAGVVSNVNAARSKYEYAQNAKTQPGDIAPHLKKTTYKDVIGDGLKVLEHVKEHGFSKGTAGLSDIMLDASGMDYVTWIETAKKNGWDGTLTGEVEALAKTYMTSNAVKQAQEQEFFSEIVNTLAGGESGYIDLLVGAYYGDERILSQYPSLRERQPQLKSAIDTYVAYHQEINPSPELQAAYKEAMGKLDPSKSQSRYQDMVKAIDRKKEFSEEKITRDLYMMPKDGGSGGGGGSTTPPALGSSFFDYENNYVGQTETNVADLNGNIAAAEQGLANYISESLKSVAGLDKELAQGIAVGQFVGNMIGGDTKEFFQDAAVQAMIKKMGPEAAKQFITNIEDQRNNIMLAKQTKSLVITEAAKAVSNTKGDKENFDNLFNSNSAFFKSAGINNVNDLVDQWSMLQSSLNNDNSVNVQVNGKTLTLRGLDAQRFNSVANAITRNADKYMTDNSARYQDVRTQNIAGYLESNFGQMSASELTKEIQALQSIYKDKENSTVGVLFNDNSEVGRKPQTVQSLAQAKFGSTFGPVSKITYVDSEVPTSGHVGGKPVLINKYQVEVGTGQDKKVYTMQVMVDYKLDNKNLVTGGTTQKLHDAMNSPGKQITREMQAHVAQSAAGAYYKSIPQYKGLVVYNGNLRDRNGVDMAKTAEQSYLLYVPNLQHRADGRIDQSQLKNAVLLKKEDITNIGTVLANINMYEQQLLTAPESQKGYLQQMIKQQEAKRDLILKGGTPFNN